MAGAGMMGAGLYVEECLQEIVGRFLSAVAAELGFQEASLRLAAPILLRDLARSLRSEAPPPEGWARGVTLVLSQPAGGVKGLLREFGLLRAALWDTLSARGHAVPLGRAPRGRPLPRRGRRRGGPTAGRSTRGCSSPPRCASARSPRPAPGPSPAARGGRRPPPIPGSKKVVS
jgi:hypothetical protein